MKKLIIFFFFGFLDCFFTIQAQSFKMGVVSESKDAELRSTDRVNGKKHFQAWPITLKKGMGVCLFMESSAFVPAIYFFSQGNGKYFGTTSTDRTKDVDKVMNLFITPADSTFYVILTSVNDDRTGAFHYGYYLLDSSQLKFNENYSLCERLGYLINHWQSGWALIPKTYKIETDDDDDDISYSEYYTTKNTLVKNKAGMISRKYEEVMYRKAFEVLGKAGNDSRDFYKKICDDISNCLDKNAWTIETEGILGEDNMFDAFSKASVTTYFFAKGGSKDDKQRSFKLTWCTPGANLMSKHDSNNYTVTLVLN